VRPEVLADRDTRVLFAGQAMNMFGNSAMLIVLGIWVRDLTGSSGAAGLVFLLLALSSLAAPMVGLLVDRFPRRRVLMLNDLLTGVLVASLAGVQDRHQVWLIYLVAVLYGVSGGIYRAARGGLLRSMVPARLLGDANGLFSSLGQGLRLIAPIAGAGLYAIWGGGAVALADTGTFLFSAASYLLLRGVPDLTRQAAGGDGQRRREFLRELVAGARHVAANPVIRRMIAASAVAFTGAGMIDVAMFSLVDQGLHRPTALIGVLGGFEGAGSILAGLLVGPLLRRLGEYGIATIGFLLNGLGLAAASTATLASVCAGAALIGLGLPLILVAELTLVQRRTPAALLGRAIAASDAIIDIPFAVAIAVAAGLIGTVGFRPIYIGVAAGFTAVGFALLPFRAVTQPEPAADEQLAADEQPDADEQVTGPPGAPAMTMPP
jgi:hypothetical protein